MPEATRGRPRKNPQDKLSGTVVNLKGTQDQIDWLEHANRLTLIPKAAIVRAALAMWGKANRQDPFPMDQ